MKIRISATIDPKTEKMLEDLIKKGHFRNQSHAIEDSIKLMVEEKENARKK